MKIKAPVSLLFFIVAGILISCASTKSHLDLAKVNSKPGLRIHDARLGIMPLQCYPADIGNIISDTIGNHLKYTGIEVTERADLARILVEKGISFKGATENSEYCRIGEICNVDYLLVGKVVVSTLHKQFIRPGRVVFTEFIEATVQIVNVATGEVVLSASIERPQRKRWHQPVIIGEALAAGIKKELTRDKQP